MHLRALAELAEVQLRSAQLAVSQLVKEKVLTREAKGNRVYFSLNQSSLFCPDLSAHFQAEKSRELQARAKLTNAPAALLERIHQLRMLSWGYNY